MKLPITLASLVLLALCSGCGNSRDSLASDSVDTMKDLVAAMDGITDAASARRAKPTLEDLFEKMGDLEERQSEMGEPTDQEMQELLTKYGDEMQATQMQLVNSMMRIGSNPAIVAELEDLESLMSESMR
jgi:hypothetical protein